MRRPAALLATIGVALVAIASPAWAHVTISPASAEKGSDAVLSFTVPNEKENATTVRIVVQFPQDHPIAEALTQPIAGWKAEPKSKTFATPIKTDSRTTTEGVDTVTWTATDGKGIPVGGFQQFSVSVGLPDADTLAFPTIQTYSDGSVVRWTQQALPGAPEPDNPQPELKLTTAASGAVPVATSSVKKSDVDNAKTMGLIGIIVGAVGVVIGGAGFALGRKRTT